MGYPIHFARSCLELVVVGTKIYPVRTARATNDRPPTFHLSPFPLRSDRILSYLHLKTKAPRDLISDMISGAVTRAYMYCGVHESPRRVTRPSTDAHPFHNYDGVY